MAASNLPVDDDAVTAVLTASRAMLGVIARSFADTLETVTLPQFRVLVLLSSLGPQRTGVLAERLGANLSTFSRSLDRMVSAGWVRREQNPGSRREVIITLTGDGEHIVADVTERRRRDFRDILAQLTPERRDQVLAAFEVFNSAAGEPSVEDLLPLGL
ncbi:MarR family winged helix-turn-helix transcriptional regulator [Humibacter ginsenosidimutans]|uniref:MarR family transcriptional regulator n=1 Tax=Humibacter ginsenosidimutans TaxID=2599293 RepID=A0A5B8M3V6_9MICO|nr:MarR family transcriptional regulator [Humibacter ginsenosidimutans]QDZ15468.1 MarR family transcriptional regulator [Humibacter ginsenosidimutans]